MQATQTKNKPNLECPHCGQEFDWRRPGPFNLHKYHCEVRKLRGKEPKQVKAEPKREPKAETCEHEWRVLNPNSQQEANAIRGGYDEVCKRCLELR